MSYSERIKIIIFDVDGIFTDGAVYVNEKGEETKKVAFHDIDAFFSLKRKGYKTALVTAEGTDIAKWFGKRFEPDHFYFGRKDKDVIVQEILAAEGLSPEEACYIGDGRSDAAAIKLCGLGVCTGDAWSTAREAANVVLEEKSNGHGVIVALHKLLEE